MALKIKIFDIPVAFGVDFFLVMLLIGATWHEPDQLIGWMIVVTVSVLAHELGHAAVAESFGAHPAIRLWGGGGITTMPALPPRQHLLVAAAGPAVGLIVGGIAAAVAASSFASVSTDPVVRVLIDDIVWVNVGWGILNLLPMAGLDGGAILSTALTLTLKRPADTLAGTIGFVFALGLLAVLLAVGLWGLAFVVGYLLFFTAMRTGSVPGLRAGRAPANPALLLRQGRYREAFETVQGHLAGHPDDLGAYALGADALRLLTEYEASLRGYDTVLSRMPADAHSLRGRICDLVALGRREEALAELARLTPTTGGAAISLASSLYALDLHADGYRYTHSPMSGDPRILRAMGNMAVVFEYATGRLDEALGHVEALLGQAPGEPDLHELRALILVDLGRAGEARAEIGESLRAAPDHPEFKQTLGLIERLAGNPRAALGPLLESARLRPHGARPRGELIACYAQLGDLMEARSALETLPGYARRDPFVAYGEAAIAAVSGSTDEARRQLGVAVAARPELGLRANRDPLFRGLAAVATGAANPVT